MLTGFADGGLELRKRASGALALQGRFPYGKLAVLSDGGRTGRPKKEVIAPRAFGFRVDDPKEDIHFLVGHSFDKPLASRGAGTLDLVDSDDTLTFTARITEEMQEVSYVKDILAGIAAGLTLGISPGFRLPPKRAVPEPEKIEDEGMDPENGAYNAIIRTVLAALLYEISVVTRPAYPEAQVEARNWGPDALIRPDVSGNGVRHALSRWRA
ncbi:HK97 family phage prohead protease [Sulfitobacter sp.]|jgi:HK97 family phage prohead protease|uniref:HK97 family phage prohead protease n=1 Tax=Sulfitobacter sp. TaxID=1903071 RepID=UPI0039E49A62